MTLVNLNRPSAASDGDDLGGGAYDMKPSTFEARLTEVGRGTPMGELLRRYWHPVGLSTHATDTPREVRILGEDLVLFRDGEGRPGLVHARCAHRGATLYYGKVEDRGIRCCYHGWLFDVKGHCLEQPCEPDMGAKFRGRVRQPWYPVEELYGLIFAYMGPPTKRPVLPRYECLENLAEGEFIDVDDTSIGSGGGAIAPCNWLQSFENVADPYHVPILHGSFSGTQFTEVMNQFPKEIEFTMTDRGVQIRSVRPLADGRTMNRIVETVMPTLRAVPNPVHGQLGVPVEFLGWTIPIDDTHYRIYTAGRVRTKGVFMTNAEGKPMFDTPRETTPEERRARPGDWEAQTGQGSITLHSEEHLAQSDRGVVMVRKILRDQLRALDQGTDPIGVSFDADAPPLKLSAGNWLL